MDASQNPSSPESVDGLDIRLAIEVRPEEPYAARYDVLPFPILDPVQEVALDIGIVALGANLLLRGLVFKFFNGHQLLMEQRWPGRIIQVRTGESSLDIEDQTGLALRGLHFLLHGHEPITMVEITAVAAVPEREGAPIQTLRQVPIRYHEPQTELHFPLEGPWWVIQGSDWSDRHKAEVNSQPFAVDLVRLGPDNRTYQNSGRLLSDHYSWDQPVYATAGGKVTYVCYDMPDMAPGSIPDQAMMRDDLRRTLGNAVAISHANGEFSYFAHLQQASIPVQVGDMVRRNTLIGRVGNSGNSPGPHLHFHVMNGPNLFLDQGLPFRFSHFRAGGHYYREPISIPTRMILEGPIRTFTEDHPPASSSGTEPMDDG